MLGFEAQPVSERVRERKELEGEGSRRKSSASSEPLWLREIAGKSDAFSPVEREHRGGDSLQTTLNHRDFKKLTRWIRRLLRGEMRENLRK